MTWRDRLLLLLMRVLAPEGIAAHNVPMAISFDPGQSTPEDPKLRMRLALASTDQPILSVVFEPSAAEWLAEAFNRLDDWATEGVAQG